MGLWNNITPAWMIDTPMTLRVTFEIVPHGIEEDKYTIGTLNIHNGESKEYGLCTYYGSLVDTNGTIADFKDVSHMRRDGYQALVYRVLHKILGSKLK